jgi:hypothetical protein
MVVHPYRVMGEVRLSRVWRGHSRIDFSPSTEWTTRYSANERHTSPTLYVKSQQLRPKHCKPEQSRECVTPRIMYRLELKFSWNTVGETVSCVVAIDAARVRLPYGVHPFCTPPIMPSNHFLTLCMDVHVLRAARLWFVGNSQVGCSQYEGLYHTRRDSGGSSVLLPTANLLLSLLSLSAEFEVGDRSPTLSRPPHVRRHPTSRLKWNSTVDRKRRD